MTANELLTLLGRAWPRLLIYPGGLAAFALVWVLGRAARRRLDQAPEPGIAGQPVHLDPWLAISAVVLPWLALSLLPLPLAAGFNRQIDLFAAIALLDWPLVLVVAFELRAHESPTPKRLAALLNGYPPLILATLALALAPGSFEIEALTRPLDPATPATAGLLHWLGAVAWTLALPAVLGIGPFAADPVACGPLGIGLRLRAIGLVGVSALVWGRGLGVLVEARARRSDAPAWVADLGEATYPFAGTGLAAALLVLVLWGYNRIAGGQPRPWARAYLVLDLALLAGLLWAAYTALQARIN